MPIKDLKANSGVAAAAPGGRPSLVERPDVFIPCTREIWIAPDIVYRPIRSSHSNVYAGEGLYKMPGSDDASGCLLPQKLAGVGVLRICQQPKSYTHRLYWHREHPERSISAFLSYPDGMGWSQGEYFWEAYIDDDLERWFGPDAEEEMEQAIITALLQKPVPNQPAAAADGGSKQKED